MYEDLSPTVPVPVLLFPDHLGFKRSVALYCSRLGWVSRVQRAPLLVDYVVVSIRLVISIKLTHSLPADDRIVWH